MSAKLEKVNIIPHDDGASLPVVHSVTPMSLLQNAVANGNIELAEKLMALQERWQAGESRKAFETALAAAKSEIPVIGRTAMGHNAKKYADFAAIAKVIDPILGNHGLSYRFRTVQTTQITVTCILFGHGHSEETTLSGPADTSGNKNAIQAIGSTLTYLQRYSLVQMLGLAAAADDDGKTATAAEPETPPPPGSISQKQGDDIRELLESLGVNGRAFLAWVKQSRADVKRVEEIPAEYFEACVAEIKRVAAARK